jgi:hypothetical protein
MFAQQKSRFINPDFVQFRRQPVAISVTKRFETFDTVEDTFFTHILHDFKSELDCLHENQVFSYLFQNTVTFLLHHIGFAHVPLMNLLFLILHL